MVVASNQLAFRLNPTAHLRDKWIVDLFCGAGGASRGIERALGRSPNLCINHNPLAILNHEVNHPASLHDVENVWKVDPRAAVGDNPVGMLWASPDCTYFSRAKGGKPMRHKGKRVRSLANVVVKWARDVRPEIIFLENVMEFTKWGPLMMLRDRDGKVVTKDGKALWVPNKDREAEYFNRWVRSLRRLGYQVEWRQLKCSEYGAPTSRKRLFLVARCDGKPIRFPSKTHGKGTPNKERAVAECINFNLPNRSIFDPGRRPLAEATKRRAAVAALRYVKNNENRYLVNLTHGGRLESLNDPCRTITGANRGEKALLEPKAVGIMTNNTGHPGQDVRAALNTITSTEHHALIEGRLSGQAVTRFHGEKKKGECRAEPVDQPLPTQTTENRFGLVGATLIRTGNGERKGQAPRVEDILKPVTTIMGDGQKHALGVCALKSYGGVVGHGVDRSLGTITTVDHHGLLGCNLHVFHGTGQGGPMDQACPVNTAQGGHLALQTATLKAAQLVHYYSNGGQDQPVSDPIHAIVGKDRHALLEAQLGNDLAGAIRVGAFLVEYGDMVPDAWLEVNGEYFPVAAIEIDGATYLMVDLCLRMLQPEELKLAQGFDADYHLFGTKADQVKMIGNSVPPQVAEALVRANVLELEEEYRLEEVA